MLLSVLYDFTGRRKEVNEYLTVMYRKVIFASHIYISFVKISVLLDLKCETKTGFKQIQFSPHLLALK